MKKSGNLLKVPRIFIFFVYLFHKCFLTHDCTINNLHIYMISSIPILITIMGFRVTIPI